MKFIDYALISTHRTLAPSPATRSFFLLLAPLPCFRGVISVSLSIIRTLTQCSSICAFSNESEGRIHECEIVKWMIGVVFFRSGEIEDQDPKLCVSLCGAMSALRRWRSFLGHSFRAIAPTLSEASPPVRHQEIRELVFPEYSSDPPLHSLVSDIVEPFISSLVRVYTYHDRRVGEIPLPAGI